MPTEKFDQYDDNQSSGQSQLLQDIKKILEEKYPDTPIKAFGKVVVLEFANSQHNVELLPAWENENKTFIIPNSKNGGSWETYDPRTEIKEIKDSDEKTGKTKMLIRMVKKWSEQCSAKVKSYKIENAVMDFFKSNGNDIKDSIMIKGFYAYFCDCTVNENLKSHLNTALSRAQKACNFENDNKFEQAIDEWKKIFGDDFPKNNVSKNTINFTPQPIINPPKPWLLD